MSRKTRLAGVVGALLTAGLLLTACGGTETATPAAATTPIPAPTAGDPGSVSTPPDLPIEEETNTPAELTVGDTATITGDGVDTGTIKVSKLRIVTGPGYSYGEPPKSGYYLIFTVKLNAKAPAVYVGEDEFYVRTPDGQHVDSGEGNAYMAIEGNTLGSADLNTGEHTTGFLTFDSPTKHGKLAYSPNYDGEPVAWWSF
jgi:hypothetical protein